MKYQKVLAPLFFSFCLIQLASDFVPDGVLDDVLEAMVSTLALVLFAVLLLRTGGSVRWTSILLIAAGLAMLAWGGVFGAGVLAEAIRFYGSVSALFLLTPLLALPVYQGRFDQAMKAVLDVYGRRVAGYAGISAVLTFFTGIFLNIGSLTLIHSLTGAGRREEKWLRVQAMSLLRGISAALLVSPYFVAMGMVTTTFGLRWENMVTICSLLVCVAFLIHLADSAWAMHRSGSGRRGALSREGDPKEDGRAENGPEGGGVAKGALVKGGSAPGGTAEGGRRRIGAEHLRRLGILGLAMAVLTAVLLYAEAATTYPMITLVSALSLLVPLAGFAALGQMRELLPVFRERYWQSRLPAMYKEILLILSSGFFACSMQVSGMSERIAEFLPHESRYMALTALFMIHLVSLTLSIIGFHPIVSTSLLLSVLSTNSFGLAPEAAGAALLSAWSLSMAMSPFSAATIITGGLVQKSSAVVALKWNWQYGLTVLPLMLLAEYLYFF